MTTPAWDWDSRPDSYWDPPDFLTALTQNVAGEMRRRMIIDIVTGEAQKRAARKFGGDAPAPELLREVAPGMLVDILSPKQRDSLARVHPQFTGGEFLPRYRKREVEIARLVLDSPRMDVVAIRARRSKDGRIHYRVVDEHEGTFRWRPKTSAEPFSFRELVAFIDGIDDGGRPADVGYVDYLRNAAVERGNPPEDVTGFVTVTSPLYPKLEPYYEAHARAWLRGRPGSA
jgi:hypothetical protein